MGSKELSISSPSKECTWALSPTARPSSEIEELSPEPQAPRPSSLATPMMERRPESDFHPEPERPSSAAAELWSVSSLEVREPISHFSRPTEPGSKPEERGTTGQELEVLP